MPSTYSRQNLNLIQILPSKSKTKLDMLIDLRKTIERLNSLQWELENELTRECLEGELDTTGHSVKVLQAVSGRRVMKSLVIDGKG